nr:MULTISPECIES: DUF3470 domain-containing protein [Rhizobium/Agrobacterium group]
MKLPPSATKSGSPSCSPCRTARPCGSTGIHSTSVSLQSECERECPAAAIRPDTEAGLHVWLDLNRHYSGIWPRVHQKRPPPDNADVMNGASAKFSIFSKNPGAGG